MKLYSIFFTALIFSLLGCSDNNPEPPQQQGSPTVSKIEPLSGGFSDIIAIHGTNLLPADGTTVVQFGQHTCKITSATDEVIYFEIPDEAIESSAVTVTTSAGNFTTSQSVTLLFPEITGLVRPLSISTTEAVGTAGVGELLYLEGKHFSRNTNKHAIRVRDAEFEVVPFIANGSSEPSTERLGIIVPENAFSGTIYLQIGGFVTSYDGVNVGPGVWKKSSNGFPGPPRDEVYSFAIDDKIYVGGGAKTTGSYVFYTDFYAYDVQTKEWSSIADIPAGSVDGFTFSVGGRGYVGGGTKRDGSRYTSLYCYDPATNQWQSKAPVPSENKFDGYGFSINDRGYVTMGLDNTLYEYNSGADQWTQRATYPGAAWSSSNSMTIGAVATLIGAPVGTPPFSKREVYRYSQLTNSWSKGPDYPEGQLNSMGAFVINNVGYAGGGFKSYHWYMLSASSDSWIPVAPIQNRWIGVGFSHAIGTVGYVGSCLVSATGEETTTTLATFTP